MKFTKYAPVIIPTLNRLAHLQRCLESLECCTGAEYTEVYIGLDYPPSERFVDGWKKVDSYLAEKEKKHKFKKMTIYRRSHNCGVGICNPGSNSNLLKNVVEKISDRYVFSEDDNEFSPNFLEYMNLALEFYKDDPAVLHVSAYTPLDFKNISSNTTFFGIDTPAYGLGYWVNKDLIQLYSNDDIVNDFRTSLKKTLKIYWTWPAIVSMALFMIKKKTRFADVTFSIYNLLHHTYTLQPSVSLSRNRGCDGSGLHSGCVHEVEKNEIQIEKHFILQDIPHEYPSRMLKKLFYRSMPTDKIRRIKMFFISFLRLIQLYFFKRVLF